MDDWEGEALALLRQGLYRFLGASFRYPEDEPFAILADTASRFDVHQMAPFAFHNRWLRFTDTLQDQPALEHLQTEHVRLFSPGPGGALCSPHESVYLDVEVQTASFILALEQEYRGLGLSVSSSYRDLPDHVTAETEAMAVLCGMEAEVWKGGRVEAARRVLEDQRGFLHRHLGRWLPRFDERIRGHTEVAFYAVLADAADAFVLHDLDLVQLRTREVAM
ncbi:MAG: molecular chaperone TorD family protein [Candidatus Thermoplasmatota archaeon]|nr:molecular chaperone TorD family protein [Candidatus Thermoplasmatota archaeon]